MDVVVGTYQLEAIVYIMRAWHGLTSEHIYWDALGDPDPTAVEAPYPLVELDDIVIAEVISLDEKTYLMRAYHTVLGQFVWWSSVGAADLDGSESGYSPGDLTGILVGVILENG